MSVSPLSCQRQIFSDGVHRQRRCSDDAERGVGQGLHAFDGQVAVEKFTREAAYALKAEVLPRFHRSPPNRVAREWIRIAPNSSNRFMNEERLRDRRGRQGSFQKTTTLTLILCCAIKPV